MVQCALHNGLMEDKPQEGSFEILILHLSQTLEDPRDTKVVVGRVVYLKCTILKPLMHDWIRTDSLEADDIS